MPDELIVPLFAHQEPGPFFTVSELSRALEEPGLLAETIASQARSFAQRRLVHVRGSRGSGRTASNLYAPIDLAAIKALSVLTSDGSVADNALLQEVSRALYTWTENTPVPAKHLSSPLLTAIVGVRDGQAWALRVNVLRSEIDGERLIKAVCYNLAKTPQLNTDDIAFVPRLTIMLNLTPLIQQVLAAAAGRASANA